MFAQVVSQYYRHPMMGRNDVGAHPIMMIVCFLVFIFIIIGVFYLAKGHSHSHGMPDKDPLDIVKERYAKGDITKDEFEQIKKDLK